MKLPQPTDKTTENVQRTKVPLTKGGEKKRPRGNNAPDITKKKKKKKKKTKKNQTAPKKNPT